MYLFVANLLRVLYFFLRYDVKEQIALSLSEQWQQDGVSVNAASCRLKGRSETPALSLSPYFLFLFRRAKGTVASVITSDAGKNVCGLFNSLIPWSPRSSARGNVLIIIISTYWYVLLLGTLRTLRDGYGTSALLFRAIRLISKRRSAVVPMFRRKGWRATPLLDGITTLSLGHNG